jgi:hypothetical protein
MNIDDSDIGDIVSIERRAPDTKPNDTVSLGHNHYAAGPMCYHSVRPPSGSCPLLSGSGAQ